MNFDQVDAAYRRALGRFDAINIRRYSGAGPHRPFFDWDCHARIVDYDPAAIVGSVKQGDQRLIVMVSDLIAVQFPLPVVQGDKVVFAGRELNIEKADGNTRRVQGRLVAYELQVRGGGP